MVTTMRFINHGVPTDRCPQIKSTWATATLMRKLLEKPNSIIRTQMAALTAALQFIKADNHGKESACGSE